LADGLPTGCPSVPWSGRWPHLALRNGCVPPTSGAWNWKFGCVWLGMAENGQYTPETAFLVGKMVIRQYGFWMILGFP